MSLSSPAEPPKCPVCRRPAAGENLPFCSAACRDRDLIAWLDERYVVPGKAPVEEGDDPGS